MSLPLALFDYDLPAQLIAQNPAGRRDEARLLVVDRASHAIAHYSFSELGLFLRNGDRLIRNNVSVLPARLYAKRPSGGSVECLLLRPEAASHPNAWWCLLRPGKKLPTGGTFFSPNEYTATVVEKRSDGTALVEFATGRDKSIADIANRLGQMPLPPYIARKGTAQEREHDRERYQTVYADPKKQLAVAAPTAGLHFTPELLAALARQGVQASEITLHVGLGTFKAITADLVEDHEIHRETYEIDANTQAALFSPTERRIAVGTTTVRAIEDFLASHQKSLSGTWTSEASLFIYPPRRFLGVDALITNFHQPRSTLLCLVAAFLAPGSLDGIEWLREIYTEAIDRRYRFFSYGDAMLIL